MIATITDNNFVYLSNITDIEDQIIWEEFSVSKPNAYIDSSMYAAWDGVYRKYNRAKKRIARPLLQHLIEVCRKRKLPLSIVDGRDDWGYAPISVDQVDSSFLPGLTLEQYQIDAIRTCIEQECGVIDVPTGGGKGELICGICKALPCPTIILADQKIVVDQLKSRLELRDVAEEIGLFYAGKRPNGQMIIVGLIQSLNAPKKAPSVPERTVTDTDSAYKRKLIRYDSSLQAYKTRLKNVKLLLEYIKRAELIIVDECDKSSGEGFKQLFRHYFKGRRRIGLSGTPFDPDKPVEAMVIKEHLGSIIFKETRENVLARGRIVPVIYKMLAAGLEGSPSEGSAYDIAYKEQIVENNRLHELIAKLCLKHKDVGILILVDRKAMGFALEAKLKGNGVEAVFIHGETAVRDRTAALKKFESRDYKVLIGGKIINRGLDLAGGCEVLIIAGSGKQQSDLIQKVGRALRKNSKGHSIIYDFFFRSNRYLYDHSKRKLKIMVESNFETKVVFPGGTINGKELIRRRFRLDRRFFNRQK
jgi:superfamily II DNA or RNA helicase